MALGLNSAKIRALLISALLLPLDALVAVPLLATGLASILIGQVRRKPLRSHPIRRDSAIIQILNWDGRHLLEECLPRVREAIAAAGGNHKILVVDNGSADGSAALVEERFPEAQILRLDRNYGFSAGNNRGMAIADTDIVVILNNDMLVDREFLAPLLAPFSDPSVFAVTSQILMPDGARREETGKTRARFERGLFYMWHDEVRPEDEGPLGPVFWAGGSSAVDRRKYEELGGFDTLYHPFYLEDADLSYRAWKHGWKSLLAPASRVTHRHRSSSRRFGESFIDNTVRRNHFLFVWKNITDLGMTLDHIVQLPRNHARSVLQRGAGFEIRAYLRAWLRLPLALYQRLFSAGTLRDGAVLQMTTEL